MTRVTTGRDSFVADCFAVKALSDRIRWILENRKFTQRELGLKAGLSSGFVSVFLTRAKDMPDASMNADALSAIARVADVSLEWLTTGAGSPEISSSTERDEGSPLRRLPLWAPTIARIKERLGERFPQWAYDRAGNLRNAYAPSPLTEEFVLRTVLYAYETVDLEERAQLARDEVAARLAAHNAQHDEAAEHRPWLPLEHSGPATAKKR